MDGVWSASRTSAEKLVASAAAQLAVSPRVHVHTLAKPGDPMAVLKDAARQVRCSCSAATTCHGVSVSFRAGSLRMSPDV